MPSFDTVLEADFVEVKNAVEQCSREIGTRFDFKGSSAAIELKDKEITLFGDADFQLTQSALGDMALRIDAAALLSYRAAWQKDVQKTNTTQEAAMAKLSATESAQWVIDRAVQMHGAFGVTVGQKVEALYRDIRAMRIYEGASEVQSLIIGRSLLKEDRDASA